MIRQQQQLNRIIWCRLRQGMMTRYYTGSCCHPIVVSLSTFSPSSSLSLSSVPTNKLTVSSTSNNIMHYTTTTITTNYQYPNTIFNNRNNNTLTTIFNSNSITLNNSKIDDTTTNTVLRFPYTQFGIILTCIISAFINQNYNNKGTISTGNTTSTTTTNDNSCSSLYNILLQQMNEIWYIYYQSNNNNIRYTYCDTLVASTTTTTINDSNNIEPSEKATETTIASTDQKKHPTLTTTTNIPKTANIQRQMTSIGRFSLISETKYNPSIITFVIQLSNKNTITKNNNNKSGGILTSKEFIQLWLSKQMDIRHPRFHQMIINHPHHHQKHVKHDNNNNTKQKQQKHLSFHPTDTTDIIQHIHESVLPCHRKELQNIIAYNQIQTWDLSKSLWYVTIYNNNNNNINNNMTTTTNWNKDYDFSLNVNSIHDNNTTTTTQTKNDIDITTTSTLNDKSNILPPTLLLFRGHHVLADGASMAAAFMDLFDEADTIRQQIYDAIQQYRKKRKRNNTIFHWLWKRYVQLIRLCYGTIQSFVHILRLTLHYMFIDNNPWKKIQQYYQNKKDTHNTDSKRVVSWSDVASVEQVKWVADTFSDEKYYDNETNNHYSFKKITVNDILTSCVSAAMAKQLQYHRQQIHELMQINKTPKQHNNKNNNNRTNKNEIKIHEQPYIHVAVPVHLKGGVVLPNESVGNNIGALVARVPCEINNDNTQHSSDSSNTCIQRLHAVHTELNTIKRTPLAIISYVSAKVLSNITTWNILPSSWISKLYANANIGSMVVVSNNRGPATPVHIHGHEVESIYGFVPLPPGIPVGVVVMSYAGRINCTLSAEPWAIPDGEQFMIWILEEYLNLVNAAKKKNQQEIIK